MRVGIIVGKNAKAQENREDFRANILKLQHSKDSSLRKHHTTKDACNDCQNRENKFPKRIEIIRGTL